MEYVAITNPINNGRSTSWASVFLSLAIFLFLIRLIRFLFPLEDSTDAYLFALLPYSVFFLGMRFIFAKHPKHAFVLFKKQDYAGAIAEYAKSYEYFQKHRWLDDYRYPLFGISSAMSFREIALVNQGFCYAQLHDGAKARQYFQQAAQEFPKSRAAFMALNFLDCAQK